MKIKPNKISGLDSLEEKMVNIYFKKRKYGEDVYEKYYNRLEELQCFRRFLDHIAPSPFKKNTTYIEKLIEDSEEGDTWVILIDKIWVSDSIFETVKDIVTEYDLNVAPERLCRLLSDINNEAEQYEKWKNDKADLLKRVEEYKGKIEVARFRDFLSKYNRHPEKNCNIQIYIKSVLKGSFEGSYVFSAIEEWLDIYLNHHPNDVEKKFNLYPVSTRSELPPYQEVFQTYFRMTVVDVFDKWLKLQVKDKSFRYKLIGQLFALFNIFNLEERSPKFHYDTINNALTRKPKTTLKQLNRSIITHIRKDFKSPI